MKQILIISGSSQANSQSLKISEYLRDVLNKDAEISQILDLNKTYLPILKSQEAKNWPQIESQLNWAQAMIWVIPEWNGGANPSIKNMLLYANSDLIGHKPVLLVGVSAGRGGFYPLMEIRTSGHKDTRYLIIPENIVVNNCHKALNTLELNKSDTDYDLKLRINYSLSILKLYQENLNKLRQSKLIDHKTYPFGM